jgi:hypothetical protein
MTDAELAAVVRGIAPIVREQIASAVSDLTLRLAAIDATLARLPAHDHALGELRERVAIVETKAAQPVPAALAQQFIDLSPVLERVAAAEARLQTLGDLRDRVVTIETKAATPAAVDLGDLPTRVAVIETQTAALADRVDALEQAQADLEDATSGEDAAFTNELGALRERVAVVEVRQPVPGPAGKDGADGVRGKDGADGLSFGDLSLLQEDERTVVVRATRGDSVKELGTVTFPVDIYRGVYQDGKTYARGDGVTWAGSEWHCHEPTTTKPGDGSKAWTLKVKRGRDGRDGVDAPGALPVVKVGPPGALGSSGGGR